MTHRAFTTFAAISLISLGPAGCRKASPQPDADVAATNSLLACAARDLLGASTPVLRLAGPGACPGHYDIRPAQVSRLRRCRVLLRLDFQKSLDAKLSSAADEGLRIVAVRIDGGLCEPESYLAACRQTADALVAAGLSDRATVDRRLAEIGRRIGAVASQCRRRAAGLKDTPVLASVHQEAFCKWLGLSVAATFSGADTAGVSQVDRAVREGDRTDAKLVIANYPEGRRVADALARRLGAKVVVFGNFPDPGNGQASFDMLLADNVSRLLEAAGQ